ncbi:MAG: patatin family protein [Lentisphaeria bacterium]|nr:patatin family protein [Lentisphaeria bacterium]
MKKGLILEGGAMRGLFSAGIFDTMLTEGVEFDGMIGVSAGAAFGCNFKSKQPGRALRYNKKYCRNLKYCSYWSWLTTGNIFGADFCYRELPLELDIFDIETFEKNLLEFYMVCTDIETGRALYKKCDKADSDCFEYMRASASMPLVSKIVEVNGGKYLDGALADSIPVKFFETLGYDRNIVILTQPQGYIKKPSAAQGLLRLIYRKYPELVKTMEKRHEIYNETVRYIEQKAARNEILLLRPEQKLPVKRMCKNPEILQQTYDIGRELAMRRMDEIKKFLAQ